MQNGTLTFESLTTLLRGLSQKRRQGVLQINLGRKQLELSFSNGKIVEVRSSLKPILEEICQRLLKAHKISLDHFNKLHGSNLFLEDISIEQLAVVLGDRLGVKRGDVIRAKHSAELDELYSLREVQDAEYEFIPRIIKSEPEFSLSISPGQVLLDLVEMDSFKGRFAELFQDLSTDSVSVRVIEESDSGLSPVEKELWHGLQLEKNLKKVADAALLSQYQLQESLLALYDRNFIEVENQGLTPTPSVSVTASNNQLLDEPFVAPTAKSPRDQETASPRIFVDEVSDMGLDLLATHPAPEQFAAGVVQSVATPVREEPVRVREEFEPMNLREVEDNYGESGLGIGDDLGVEDLIDEMSQLLAEGDSIPSSFEHKTFAPPRGHEKNGWDKQRVVAPVAREIILPPDLPERAALMTGVVNGGANISKAADAVNDVVANCAEAVLDCVPEDLLTDAKRGVVLNAADGEETPTLATSQSIYDLMLQLNYCLLEQSTLSKITAILMMIYLSVFAIVGPGFIEDWFKALQGFSSKQ